MNKNIINFYVEQEIKKVSEAAEYLWQKGWAERNGGNISLNLSDKIEVSIKDCYNCEYIKVYKYPKMLSEKVYFVSRELCCPSSGVNASAVLLIFYNFRSIIPNQQHQDESSKGTSHPQVEGSAPSEVVGEKSGGYTSQSSAEVAHTIDKASDGRCRSRLAYIRWNRCDNQHVGTKSEKAYRYQKNKTHDPARRCNRVQYAQHSQEHQHEKRNWRSTMLEIFI